MKYGGHGEVNVQQMKNPISGEYNKHRNTMQHGKKDEEIKIIAKHVYNMIKLRKVAEDFGKLLASTKSHWEDEGKRSQRVEQRDGAQERFAHDEGAAGPGVKSFAKEGR